MKEILQFPDPILLTPSEKITIFDKDLRNLAIEMLSIVHNKRAVGLSANQIGINKHMFVMSLNDKDYIFVNAKITKMSGEQTSNEGCLSSEGVYKEITRPLNITIEYQDVHGKQKHKGFSGLAARCCVHEMLHCLGYEPLETIDLTDII